MSEEARRLLSTAPRREDFPYVLPLPNDSNKRLSYGEHYSAWARVLKAAGMPHVGTHGIRHRSATDIANSGVPIKECTKTALKTCDKRITGRYSSTD